MMGLVLKKSSSRRIDCGGPRGGAAPVPAHLGSAA